MKRYHFKTAAAELRSLQFHYLSPLPLSSVYQSNFHNWRMNIYVFVENNSKDVQNNKRDTRQNISKICISLFIKIQLAQTFLQPYGSQ